MKYARANPSTQQTNTSLVSLANPVQVIKTKTIYVSSDTEMEVTLSSSASASILFKQYVGARGGTVLPLELEVPIGQGLTYSTSAPGNVFILMGYEVT